MCLQYHMLILGHSFSFLYNTEVNSTLCIHHFQENIAFSCILCELCFSTFLGQLCLLSHKIPVTILIFSNFHEPFFFFCPWFNFMPVVKWPSLTYVSSSRIILLPSIEKGRICDIQISTTEQEFWMLGSHTRGSSQGWEFAGKVSIW